MKTLWIFVSELEKQKLFLVGNDLCVSKISAFSGEKLPNSFEKLTFLELKNATIRYAKALRALGVREGDRVCGYMPNCFECVIAMLATASLGAVWSSTSPDFGVMVRVH